ncbi:MAG: HD domain-containing protein [Clostridia bacterium]|nr:HD domain-containing protein [Clostridia bacterium]
MNRVNAIYCNKEYRKLLDIIADKEADREFCRHGLGHLLDVARIAAIIAADSNMDIKRDIIYAAALMHDTGRAISDSNHAKESARVCLSILPECGYSEDETDLIADAVANHSGGGDGLAEILFKADKLSRICCECAVSDKCKWDKINTEITL